MLRALLVALLGATLACSSTAEKLEGRWETVGTPKRTMELREDQTYSWRLSGKTLGFLSDLVGPQMGTWSVDGAHLVLAHTDSEGVAQSNRLLIGFNEDGTVTLGEDRWTRLAP